jgi:hypothetical protein
MRKADMTDTTPGDFSISTAHVRTTISLFPLFGDLGLKVEETKCANLRLRKLRNIHALLFEASRQPPGRTSQWSQKQRLFCELAHFCLHEEFEQANQPAEARFHPLNSLGISTSK